MIPQCLANSSEALLVIDLRSNNFHGIIPKTFANGIKMIALSENQLRGQVPPSLANCTMLQTLVLGNNHIEGTFPFLLGALPDLQVLILRSNKFHGVIENPEINLAFPKLRIIDLSHNGFSGNLPSNYFKNWNAMKMEKLGNLTYMEADVSSGTDSRTASPPPPLHSSQKDETGFTSGIYWMIFMGYGSGLTVGLVIGTALTRSLLHFLVVDLPDGSTTTTTTVVVASPAHPRHLAPPREQPETGSGAIIVIGMKILLSSPSLSSLSLDSPPGPRRMMTGLDKNPLCGIFTSLDRTSQPQPPSIDENPLVTITVDLSLRLQLKSLSSRLQSKSSQLTRSELCCFVCLFAEKMWKIFESG
ncbi:hypothetical protein RHGRI_009770 [Rhododendron griersonianum]|uniref:Uncharacterized protein n=1 Tax=Rhododendron griersonianum TaxID=479676 RepID=A0AAV6KG32_9ERIC|nr:hypothetical protein RHGRI_009770 [Rhododendron griersonianum]